jgi:metal-responsive CopG/Arc/MetJ family transcriptional regulator
MLLDTVNMATRPVQISIDQKLLDRIDRDPETKRHGRSAFIRAAVELYLAQRRRRDIDARIRAAFEGSAEELLAETEAWAE